MYKSLRGLPDAFLQHTDRHFSIPDSSRLRWYALHGVLSVLIYVPENTRNPSSVHVVLLAFRCRVRGLRGDDSFYGAVHV